MPRVFSYDEPAKVGGDFALHLGRRSDQVAEELPGTAGLKPGFLLSDGLEAKEEPKTKIAPSPKQIKLKRFFQFNRSNYYCQLSSNMKPK